MQDCVARKRRFVWTKFGVEAGQTVAEILDRKELERQANRGVFLWGIGNNIGQSLEALAKLQSPEVLFSPIASTPRFRDAEPEEVYVWTAAETIGGVPFRIPAGSLVTSRGGAHKNSHYALVCRSDVPLRLENANEVVHAGNLRNLVSGRQVGSSQVTSVVELTRASECGRTYPVAMKIRLNAPYFVRLSKPVLFPKSLRKILADAVKRKTVMMEVRDLISSSLVAEGAKDGLCFA